VLQLGSALRTWQPWLHCHSIWLATAADTRRPDNDRVP
jgi:hypothetical protein